MRSLCAAKDLRPIWDHCSKEMGMRKLLEWSLHALWPDRPVCCEGLTLVFCQYSKRRSETLSMEVSMLRWLAILVSSCLLILPSNTWAQEETQAPGLKESVGRIFSPAGQDGSALGYLEAWAVQFETAENASSAIDLWFDQIREQDQDNTWDLSGIKPVGVEPLSDEVRALTGTVSYYEDDSITAEVAVLVVGDKNVLYTFMGWSDYSWVMDETVDVAKRTLGIDPLEFAPIPSVGYETGGLWDLLPRIEHMPEGLTWEEDFRPCRGAFGAIPCTTPTTPVATPI
jgi:hypothetical protein